jgi:hypothetical protein
MPVFRVRTRNRLNGLVELPQAAGDSGFPSTQGRSYCGRPVHNKYKADHELRRTRRERGSAAAAAQ